MRAVRMKAKGALVTGAGVRIGRALARALAADGYFVFVHHHRAVEGARAPPRDSPGRGMRSAFTTISTFAEPTTTIRALKR